MNCNDRPLKEICETAQEFKRESALFGIESGYQTKQAARAGEWQDLAEQQPILVNTDDKLDERDQFMLRLEATVIAMSEDLDSMNYVLDKANVTVSQDRLTLLTEAEDCPGPIKTRSRKFFGKIALTCACEARQARARSYQHDLRLDPKND